MTQRHVGELVRNQKPVKLSPAASVKDACKMMRDHRCGAVLVVEGEDRLVGIFTGRDAVGRVLAESKDPAKTKLADVMTPNPAAMAKGAIVRPFAARTPARSSCISPPETSSVAEAAASGQSKPSSSSTS